MSSRNPNKKVFPWRRQRHTAGGAVGTEAKAIDNMTKNSKAFGYPAAGFVTRIEHSLLYNMISEPDVYPAAAVLEQIDEEDFSIYLQVAEESRFGGVTDGGNHEPIVSYAQLSAIVALSAEKYPPKERGEDQMSDDDSQEKQQSVSQKVCKKVLQCVIRYAEEHDLDREAEIQELMAPVEKRFKKRQNTDEVKSILPFYVGYTASILTGNPLPMLAGAAVMTATVDSNLENERQNMESILSETSRRADVEKTGLLDETDHG